MEPLLPAVQRLFDDSRREQQHFVQTAEIKRNLRQTTETALHVLSVLAERGETLDQQMEHSRIVMDSSAAMAKQVEYLRGPTGWRAWLSCCFCAPPSPSPPPPPPETKRRVFQFNSK